MPPAAFLTLPGRSGAGARLASAPRPPGLDRQIDVLQMAYLTALGEVEPAARIWPAVRCRRP